MISKAGIHRINSFEDNCASLIDQRLDWDYDKAQTATGKYILPAANPAAYEYMSEAKQLRTKTEMNATGEEETIMEKQELNKEEMEQVAGGWEFHTEGKHLTWLNGYDIKCPYCGNGSADVVKKAGASPSEVLFKCEACRKDFYLRWDRLYNKINVIKS